MSFPPSLRIPFVDLSRASREIWPTAREHIEHLALRADFVAGDSVVQLESLLAQQCGVKEVACCANGTDALILALQAGGIGVGHRVAVPNLTFWATYEAIAHVGATPVLIDVDHEHLQLSIDELLAAHKVHGLDACIIVHLFGWCHPDLKRLRALCVREGIRLIEDGAQAYGVSLTGEHGDIESVFQGAEIATLSFYPTKVLGGCMDGGAVTTNCSATARRIRSLLNHGRKDAYSYEFVGWNSRMSSFQAAYLCAALPRATGWLESRRQALSHYASSLSRCGIEVITAPPGILGNGYLAVLRLPQELVSKTQQTLRDAGIGTARVYPETLHQQEPAKGAVRHSDLAVSTLFTRQVLNIPLFPDLTKSEQDEVLDTVSRVFL